MPSYAAHLDFPGFFLVLALAEGAFGAALGTSLWSPITVLSGQMEKAMHF